MRRGLDTNVLIYAHLPAFEAHAQVRGYLLEQLRNPEVTLVLTPNILHEFIHIVTDARRFDPPLTMAEAVAAARLYLGRSNVDCVEVDEAALLVAFELLDRYSLGRRRIADTLFAATLLQSGVEDVITCNPDDFRVVEGLRVIDPRESTADRL